MATQLPSNVRVSRHPCLRAKLSQLRSQNTNAREAKLLVHEIATIVACEALAEGLQVIPHGAVSYPATFFSGHVWLAMSWHCNELRRHRPLTVALFIPV